MSKPLWRIWLSRLLLLVMVASVALVGYGYYLTTQTMAQDLAVELATQDISVENRQADLQERKDNAYYQGEVEAVHSSELAEARRYYEETVREIGIGAVHIPSINLSEPLLAGTSHEALLNGVGTPTPDQQLGKGLFVGLSHEMQTDQLLGRINEVPIGEWVYFTDFDKVYVYQVTENIIVHMTDTELLEESPIADMARFVLYRCHGGYGTEYRQVIAGDLMDVYDREDATDKVQQGLGIAQSQSDVRVVAASIVSVPDKIDDLALQAYGIVGSNQVQAAIIFIVMIGIYLIL